MTTTRNTLIVSIALLAMSGMASAQPSNTEPITLNSSNFERFTDKLADHPNDAMSEASIESGRIKLDTGRTGFCGKTGYRTDVSDVENDVKTVEFEAKASRDFWSGTPGLTVNGELTDTFTVDDQPNSKTWERDTYTVDTSSTEVNSIGFAVQDTSSQYCINGDHDLSLEVYDASLVVASETDDDTTVPMYNGVPRTDYTYSGNERDLFEQWQDGQISTDEFQSDTYPGEGTASLTLNSEEEEESRPGTVGGSENRPRDPNDDGVFEDVNGDGLITREDAELLRANEDSIPEDDIQFFDPNGNGEIEIFMYTAIGSNVEGPKAVGGSENRPRDPDDDRLFEDVNGDEIITREDAELLRANEDSIPEDDIQFFDRNDNGEIDIPMYTEITSNVEGPKAVGGSENLPRDPDDDRIFEDVNGDEELSRSDTDALTTYMDSIPEQDIQFFDLNENGRIDDGDVEQLRSEVSSDDVPSPVGNSNRQPTDPDDDGIFEDVNGDGEVNTEDSDLLSNNEDSIPDEDIQFFDPNDNGEIEIFMYTAIGSMTDSRPEAFDPYDSRPTDPDGDGKYEDLNGDSVLSFGDLTLMDDAVERAQETPSAIQYFNFDSADDSLTLERNPNSDLQDLAQEISQESENQMTTEANPEIDNIEVESPGEAIVDEEEFSVTLTRDRLFVSPGGGGNFAELERAAEIGGVGAISVSKAETPSLMEEVFPSGINRSVGDLDSDQKYEDIDGDGFLTADDAAVLATAIKNDDDSLDVAVVGDAQPPFDFSDDGSYASGNLGRQDVRALAEEIEGSQELIVSTYIDREVDGIGELSLESENVLRAGGRSINFEQGETFELNGSEVEADYIATKISNGPASGATAVTLSSSEEEDEQQTEQWLSKELGEGWNLVSVPDASGSTGFRTSDITDDCNLATFNGNRFWSLEGGTWDHPDSVPASKGVLVKTQSECIVNFTDTVSSRSLQSPRSLGSGWNTFSVPQPATLSSVSGTCDFREFNGRPLWKLSADGQGPVFERLGFSDTLQPGEAYYGITRNDCRLNPDGQASPPPTPEGFFTASPST